MTTSEEKIVTKEVAVLKMEKPKFLTLTKSPANQIAFKIVRGDEGRKRVLKRAANPSLAIIFPDDMSEEECKSLMAEYGFETYTLAGEDTDDGKKKWKAYRNDIKPEAIPTDALHIAVGGGVKLVIERKHTRRKTSDTQGIALVALEFSLEKFPEQELIGDWIRRNGVDFDENRIQNSDTSVLYRRAEVPDKAEIGKVEIADGVIAHVTRQEQTDVPAEMYGVVSEAAYGSWGWGQLDFGAVLADVEFTEATREAVDVLHRVLTDILFWSSLPLAVRKELVARATSQFTSYVIELMDALPPKTVMINRSMKEQEMTKKDEGKQQSAEDIKRAEDEAKAKAEADAKAAADAAAQAEAQKPVTRAEVAQIVTEAVKAAFEALAPKKAGDEKPADQPAKAEDKPADENGKAILRSLEAVSEGMKAVTETVKGLSEAQGKIVERIERVEGTTTVRSDGKDGKPGSGDVFKGMFGKRSA
jgi:hypothetical protein